MKKENDEIIDLFRSRLTDTEMDVRDGFWENLSEEVPMACQHRRRLFVFRVAAAASVLLVLAASSVGFWYLFPQEEMEEAFTQIQVANGGRLDGDGIRVNPLPTAVHPVLAKQAPRAYGMMPTDAESEDSVSITFSMSFSFSSSSSVQGSRYVDQNQTHNWQAAVDNGAEQDQEPSDVTDVVVKAAKKKGKWAAKALVGLALPADNGAYKVPLSAGVTVERKLSNRLGIETGLLYSNLRSAGQKLHYLGIPVKLNVNLLEAKKVDLYATAGMVADKCIAGAPSNSFKDEPIQLAVTAGVGVTYRINDRLALFAEPGITHHFKTDSELATVRTKRPTNFNLLCGVRMTY